MPKKSAAKSLSPKEKLERAERLYAAGKKKYAERDRLLKEIVNEVGVGVAIPGTMPAVKIVDRFADADVVFQPAAARRFEIKRA